MSKSDQEKFIHWLSPFVMGQQGLFEPKLYGNNAEEPADLVWVTNRCAFLMYMKSGKKSYERKSLGNLRQLGRWLKDWRSGRFNLEDKDGKISLSFNDVDHIVGLSIVGGAEATQCEFHFDYVSRFSEYKLSLCATVTDRVMYALANALAFPRDMIRHLGYLKFRQIRIGDDELIDVINRHLSDDFQEVRKMAPQLTINNPISQADVFSEIFQSMRSMRVNDLGEQWAEFFYDIELRDLMWMMITNIRQQANLPRFGEYGHTATAYAITSGIYRLVSIVMLNDKHGGELFDQVLKAQKDQPGLIFLSSFPAGLDNMSLRAMMPPGRRDSKSLIETEIDLLKAK